MLFILFKRIRNDRACAKAIALINSLELLMIDFKTKFIAIKNIIISHVYFFPQPCVSVFLNLTNQLMIL